MSISEINDCKSVLSEYSSKFLLSRISDCSLRYTHEIVIIKFILLERGIDILEIEKAEDQYNDRFNKIDPFKAVIADKYAKNVVLLILFFFTVYVIETLIYMYKHP